MTSTFSTSHFGPRGVLPPHNRFTALLHHVYDVDMLREAYFSLKRDAAPDVDGETWQHYGEDLEANLQDLSRRLKEGRTRQRRYGGRTSPKQTVGNDR